MTDHKYLAHASHNIGCVICGLDQASHTEPTSDTITMAEACEADLPALLRNRIAMCEQRLAKTQILIDLTKELLSKLQDTHQQIRLAKQGYVQLFDIIIGKVRE